jgi:hypothetical protein
MLTKRIQGFLDKVRTLQQKRATAADSAAPSPTAAVTHSADNAADNAAAGSGVSQAGDASGSAGSAKAGKPIELSGFQHADPSQPSLRPAPRFRDMIAAEDDDNAPPRRPEVITLDDAADSAERASGGAQDIEDVVDGSVQRGAATARDIGPGVATETPRKLSLEWLRQLDDKASAEVLMSVAGLGVKSTG